MAKKIVSDLDLKGKVVLERADFNVPLKTVRSQMITVLFRLYQQLNISSNKVVN